MDPELERNIVDFLHCKSAQFLPVGSRVSTTADDVVQIVTPFHNTRRKVTGGAAKSVVIIK